jgi:peptidyl-prolyl cis-trans isomerase D
MEGFRTLVRGWLGKALMLLISLPFVLFGVDSYFSGGSHAEIAATVDKQNISRHELDQKVDAQRKELLSKVGGNIDLINDSVLHQQVLDNLIAQSVILNQAHRLGFIMTDNQIIELLHREPSFQKDGKFSDDLFQAYLRSSGQDRISLFKMVRDQTSLSLMAQGITTTSISGGGDANRIMKLQTEKRDVQFSTVLATPYLSQVNVTDAQISSYYNANKAHLNSLEQVSLDYVTLDSNSFSNKINVTDQDLQTRYQAIVQASASNEQRDAQHILISADKIGYPAAKNKIESLAAQIKAGADFGVLAKANSDDQGSAANNGDLGFAGHGIYAPEFDKALFALQVNQVSEPVKTQYGYHLIKLLGIKKADVPSFDSVKAQLMVDATQTKLNGVYSDAQSQINEQAASADSLVELAKTNNLSISHSGLMGRSGMAGDFSNKDLLTTAFTAESLKDRKISSGISISPTRTMWIQVTQYLPVKPLSLAEATPKIRATLQMQGALLLAKAKADEIAASLNSGKTIEQTTAALGVTFQDMGQVSRDKGLPSATLSDTAFSIIAPSAGRTNAKTVNVASGIVVIAVSKVMDDAAAITPELRTQIQSSLATMRGQQELEDYVEYLKSKAKIETYNTKSNDAS